MGRRRAKGRPVSGWLHRTTSAGGLAPDFAAAAEAAATGCVASLIAPADLQEAEVDDRPGKPSADDGAFLASRLPSPERESTEALAEALRAARAPALLLGGSALRAGALLDAGRISQRVSARLLSETFPARVERGPGLPETLRLPYFPEGATGLLAEHDLVVCVGCAEPVTFFGYPDIPSAAAPSGTRLRTATPPGGDVAADLAALADALGAPPGFEAAAREAPASVEGPLDPGTFARAVAAAQPEGAIVVDEGLTSTAFYAALSTGAPSHDVLTLTGGAIGQGLPSATGAAVACPDRPVIALQADGSGLYTLQSLWTQAREGLHVVTVICANRSYRILQAELARAGMAEAGPVARGMTELARPAVDWVALARGFGVPGVRVDRAETLQRALVDALAADGPTLIEALLP